MAEVNFDVNSLFEKAFGFGRGKPYDSQQIKEGTALQADGYDVDSVVSDQEGTEFVNMRNTIRATDKLGRQLFLPMQIGTVLLPNEPTVSITGRKMIIETGLVGSERRGSVKELIRQEDYTLTIRGIAINQESKRVYPEDTVKELHELYLLNESLKVESALTSLLGIYRLVIKQITFPEMVGIQHAQAYELLCVSDEDFELNID